MFPQHLTKKYLPLCLLCLRTATAQQPPQQTASSKLDLATPALTFAEPYQAVNIQNLNITRAETTH
jgi:hypothetical protein